MKIDDDRTVESKGSEFSPGKDRSLSVANYVSQIGQNWQRGVDAFMTIARLCAEASARLTITERGELLKQLPFGEATFSKFVRIGTDTRLSTPEVQRLLPPHYTTMYAVTLLTDQELSRAITDKVIHPDMKRDQLHKWRNSHREPPMKVGAVTSPPIQDKLAVQDGLAPGPLSLQQASQRKQSTAAANSQTGSEVRSPDVTHTVAIEEVAGPSTTPPNDEEIPGFLDGRPLSPEDQRALDVIMAAWDTHVRKPWNSASAVVRERFFVFLWSSTSSR